MMTVRLLKSRIACAALIVAGLASTASSEDLPEVATGSRVRITSTQFDQTVEATVVDANDKTLTLAVDDKKYPVVVSRASIRRMEVCPCGQAPDEGKAPDRAPERGSLRVPLIWRATESVPAKGPVILTGLAAARVRFEAIADGRSEKALIGQNREDRVAKPVSTSGDVAAFVTKQVVSLLDSVGVTPAAEGDVVISTTLKRFFVVETNMYQGEVVLAVRVADSAGTVRWEAIVAGRSERFGRSYKTENYQEAFSDAVVDLVYKLLSAPGFAAALRSEAPIRPHPSEEQLKEPTGPPKTPAMAPPAAPADAAKPAAAAKQPPAPALQVSPAVSEEGRRQLILTEEICASVLDDERRAACFQDLAKQQARTPEATPSPKVR
jgi:hypothetical protein